MPTSDPPRILDDPGAPAQLRELLASAREDTLDGDAIERVREGLERSIEAAGPGTATPASASVSAKLLAALGLGAVVVAAIVISHDPTPSASAPVPTPAPVSAPVVAQPALELPEPGLAPVPANLAPETPNEVTTDDADLEPPDVSAKSPRPKPATPAQPQAETELLLAARRALSNSPARALALTEQHAKAFPDSTLSEERDVISIKALVALGKATRAKRRGDAFMAAHPGSSHRPAVEAALAALDDSRDGAPK